nr:hypothetical protein [Tanacetum cinerariifolium]
MYKRRNNEGHLCSYYKSKVSEFLNFAFLIKKVVEVRTLGSKVVFCIKCPCSRCKIKVFKERHEVEYDLWSNGFIRGYTTWNAHGERESKPKEIGQCSKSMEVDNVGGCTRMILDMLEADNEHAPNLHSKPLEEATNSYAKEYYDMLEADDVPLYEGCQKYSTREAATRLLNWKAECNVPEATYNRALSIFKDMLPKADNEHALNLHSKPLEEATNSYAKEYYDMLEADDEPLYEGCQKYSTREAATRLLNWKAECNVHEATYNRALSIFKDMLPKDPYIDEETLNRARDEKFTQWFKEHIQSNDGNKHSKVLSRGPMHYVESYKAYANKNDEVISLVTQGEMEEVSNLDIGNVYMEVNENEEEFVDTYDNMEVSEDEGEFIDTYDDLDDNYKLNLSDHSFDDEEVTLSDQSLNG